MQKIMKKKKIKNYKFLRIITSLNPKYGGPAKGIIDSSEDLISKGHNVTIVTLDKKAKNANKKSNFKIINFKNYIGENYKFSLNFFKWLFKKKNDFDFIIIHGLWQFPSLAARLLLNGNYYVFSHGQLDPFFSQNWIKKIKKKIYWFLIEKRNLINSKSLLLTSLGEKYSLNKTYVNCEGVKKKVVGYGIRKPIFNSTKARLLFYKKLPYLRNKIFFLFLGRFDKKKGCEILIKSINKIRNNFKYKVLLAGPGYGENHQILLEKLVTKYKLQDQIIFSKPLYNEEKWGAISECNCMLLSSHGENFGISLVESLSLSKPVITTNKVNISKRIMKYNAGIISKNNVASFSKSLKKYIDLSQKKKNYMSRQALKCFDIHFNISSKKNSLLNFFDKQI